MEYLLLIIGFIFAVASGVLFVVSLNNNNVPPFIYILLFSLSFILLDWSNITAKLNNKYTIKALNGTLQYDTVSLDKNGKLLEIKIK